MNTHNRVLRFICAYLLLNIIVSIYCCVSAIEAKSYSQTNFDHDKFLYNVLIDSNQYKQNETRKEKLKMLYFASYLCIDQFNNNSKSDETDQARLDWLREKVKGLPKSIDEINPEKNSLQLSPSNHRTYTHRGWKYPYINDLAHSEIRADILKNTVKTVFDFQLAPESDVGKWIGNIMGVQYSDAQCESFCKLIYYVHLLGDCYEDQNYKQANGDNNGRKIPLGRSNSGNTIEDSDIVSEILNLLPKLFSDKVRNMRTYKKIISDLESKKEEIRILYGQIGGVYNDIAYSKYHGLTTEVMQIMIDHIPLLLYNEPFFAKVFY